MEPNTGMTRKSRRLSCEQCHQSKVKCVFEDSSICVRCRSRRIECSQRTPRSRARTSKPRARRKAGNTKAPRPQAPDRFDFLPADARIDMWAEHGESKDALSGTTSPDFAFEAMAFDTATPGLDFTSITADFFSNDITLSSSMVDSTPFQTPSTESDKSSAALDVCTCLGSMADILGTMQAVAGEGSGLDNVLQCNRDAVSALNRVLACERVHGTAVASLASFVTQRVICLYGVALELCCAIGSHSNALDPEIRLGLYAIGGADGPPIKRQVVLLEIRKLEPLLDRLALASAGEAEDSHAVCALMHGSLRLEVDGLIQRASVVQ